MSRSRSVIFGGGTMGSALAEQIVRARVVRRSDVTIIEHHVTRRRMLGKEGFAVVANSTPAVLNNARVVFLAVKPQDALPLLRSLRVYLDTGTLVISIMAGVSLRTLQRLLGHNRVVRCMPNLAATVGLGMTAWYASSSCSPADRSLVKKYFQAFGTELRVTSDDAIDRLTTVSGSGPGYLFAFARDYVSAVQALGFQKRDAEQLVKHVIVGAAELYRGSNLSADGLYSRVASKRGTTAAANDVLGKGRSAQLWKKALYAAYRRARSISQSLDRTSEQR